MKILMIGPYPIVKPIHGGQLRARAIYERYLQEGYDVRYCAYMGKGWYDDIDELDVEIGIQYTESVYEYVPDVLIAKMLLESSDAMASIRSQLWEYRPEVIQFEQSFLYEAFKPLLDEYKESNKISVIYSSHNIEADLKRDILAEMKDIRISNQEKNDVVKRVWKMETMLAKEADKVIACTEADAKKLRLEGVRDVVVFKNGISPKPRIIGGDELRHWQDWKAKRRIAFLFVFVGSAHPPNASGFLKMIGDRVGFLPHNIGVAVAGGVGDLLQAHLDAEPEYIRETFNLRVHLLGKLTDEHLTSLLQVSDSILLPISGGGGSNLKTAEAIYSGKPIIATSVAFRSYEEYVDLPSVTIADSRKEFHEAILNIANQPSAGSEGLVHAEKVTWEYILGDLPEKVGLV